MKKPVIEFKNFNFQYRVQHEPTLKNINLTIYEGEKVLILGPSGSGKSTLASTLNGLIPFNAEGTLTGSLKINGKETKDLSIFELSQMVGTVLQNPDHQFVGLTVGEDIAFGLENRCVPQNEMKKLVKEIAEIVELDRLLDASPHYLSGGQKQHTTLGGVLVSPANILLFDEPLASLDPATGERAIALIDEVYKEKNKTVIIIEHRLEDVLHRPIDRIILMNAGEIVADTTPCELLTSDLLTRYGIREPLYVTALKHAGCSLDAFKETYLFKDINFLPYKEKLEALMTAQEKVTPSPQDEVLLEFENVHFGYEKRKPLLEDINFKLHKGEMVSLVGKNGAGKSTLSKLICGFYKPTKGRLLLQGKDMRNLTIKERSQSIGIVLQNPNQMISKAMIYDEVALSLRLQGLPEDEVKEKVNATLKVCGLYQMRNWPISALSFGQKKRVTIASILVMNPDILILDEPTAGQDFKHYTEMMEFLKMLNDKGTTILMITHDMHLMLEYTDRAIVLSDGKIIADHALTEVLTSSSITSIANLKETSIFTLGIKANLENPRAFVKAFIEEDRRRRNLCKM